MCGCAGLKGVVWRVWPEACALEGVFWRVWLRGVAEGCGVWLRGSRLRCQLSITHVHIRFEDDFVPSDKFAIGITIRELLFKPYITPEKHAAPSAKEKLGLHRDSKGRWNLHRVAQINHLAVYWNQVPSTFSTIADCLLPCASPLDC